MIQMIDNIYSKWYAYIYIYDVDDLDDKYHIDDIDDIDNEDDTW